MAKKNKVDLGVIATAVAALLGVVAVIMLFVPSLAVVDSDTTYKATEIVFGLKKTEPIIGEVIYFEFSFMNLLTYNLLPLAWCLPFSVIWAREVSLHL